MVRFLILFAIFFISCNQQAEKQPVDNDLYEIIPEPTELIIPKVVEFNEFIGMSNDSLWNYLAFQKGGCLTGGQYVRGGKFGGEACIMIRSKEWNIFSKRDKNELTAFLVSKFPKRDTTIIHVCPFFVATEGELAVYTLQKIHKKNWFDFDDFSEYQNRETVNSLDNPQSWLQKILRNKKQRKKMKDNWMKEIVS